MLLDNVVEGGEDSPARRQFEENRQTNRWDRDKALTGYEAEQAHKAWLLGNDNSGIGWRDEPLNVGDGEGELPADEVHISGRIFGMDSFASSSVPDEEEEDPSLFDVDVEEEEDAWMQ